MGVPVVSAGNWSLVLSLAASGFSVGSPDVVAAAIGRPAVIIGLGAADWYVGSPAFSYLEITVSAPPRIVPSRLVASPEGTYDRRQRMAVLDPNRYGGEFGITPRRAELILARSKRKP